MILSSNEKTRRNWPLKQTKPAYLVLPPQESMAWGRISWTQVAWATLFSHTFLEGQVTWHSNCGREPLGSNFDISWSSTCSKASLTLVSMPQPVGNPIASGRWVPAPALIARVKSQGGEASSSSLYKVMDESNSDTRCVTKLKPHLVIIIIIILWLDIYMENVCIKIHVTVPHLETKCRESREIKISSMKIYHIFY